ncbi:DEKNAAC104869 [Brettanomyces naardenensis]|uniref:DEKNAAC104869 n=1 Tax=Brettanomyces naardenensis TaxID=13370 RepID=A0A448YSE7_BRENA|nr:DEKNAAC104869 [Brettanomyces naardenensis]
MSSYSLNQVKAYANGAISEILPLDDETISQMVNYAISELRTRDAVSQHFINLLGETPKALEFITKFSNMIFGDPNKKISTSKIKSSPSVRPEANPTKKNGDVWASKQADKPSISNQRLKNAPLSGTSTSELLDKKPTIVREDSLKKKYAQRTLDNLKDLDAALNELEVSDTNMNKERSDKVIRVCNCNATRHPLFEMFPNCLNCGKIICAREGFQPCSYCGKELLTNEERLQIMEVLKKEKEGLEGKSNTRREFSQDGNRGHNKKNVIKISINSTGQNNYKVQDLAFKRIEKRRELERKKEEMKKKQTEETEQVKKELEHYKSIEGKDEELLRAQERLDTLMNFQDNGAERTKIIDQASDYDLPSTSYNLWATPMERALQLKRQQKQLRKSQDAEDRRSGRGKRVVDMSIRSGKVYLREVDAPEEIPEDLSDDEEIQDLKAKVSDEKANKLEESSHNVWDYKSDASKWARPVYLGTPGGELETTELTPTPNVVQLGDTDEQEAAIFGMTGL